MKRRLALWLARRVAKLRTGPAAAMPSRDNIRHITVLKLDRIGDFIFATAFLRPLAEQMSAAVTLIVRKPNGSIAKQQFPGWKIIELPARETAWRNIFRQGARTQLSGLENADLLVDLRAYRDYSDAVIASWVPAACRIAIENAFPAALASVTFPHEAQIYDLLLPRISALPVEARDLANQRALRNAVLGTSPEPALPRLVLPHAEAKAAAKLLHERCGIAPESHYVVICPGTSSSIKEYPTAKLADALLDGFKDCELPLLIAGTSEDMRTTKPLIAALAGKIRAVDATGIFPLPQHLALLASARLVVSMDSCHVHIAAALGTPCVCIFGGGQFGEFGPWGESPRLRWVHEKMDCYGCEWLCIHPRPLCVQEIPPSRIAAAIREVLAA